MGSSSHFFGVVRKFSNQTNINVVSQIYLNGGVRLIGALK